LQLLNGKTRVRSEKQDAEAIDLTNAASGNAKATERLMQKDRHILSITFSDSD
jgi:hypothetical protein